MENKELLEAISRRLSVLITLQMKAQSEKFSITEGVALLSRFGMRSNEIAEILNTSTGVISVMKGRNKKKK